MEVAFSILTLLGMGYGIYCGLRWMMRSGITNARKEQPLTPNDLKVLEESAARLMADLRTMTDECVARIDRACCEAEARIQSLENISPSFTEHPINTNQKISTPVPQLYEMIELDDQPAGIDTYAGMTKGEIELMQGLKAIAN